MRHLQESVIYSPPGMLVVALSATMRNVQDIRDWFVAVHGPTGHALLYVYIYIYIKRWSVVRRRTRPHR